MAIDTTNEKLALLELDQPWEPGLPISPGSFDQADQQQLLWGYPGILWEEFVPVVTPRRGGGYPYETRKRRQKQWEERDKERRRLREMLESAYAAAMGIDPEPAPAVVAAVSEFVKDGRKNKRRLPKTRRVDFERMSQDIERAEQVLAMLQDIVDEDDTVAILLLS